MLFIPSSSSTYAFAWGPASHMDWIAEGGTVSVGLPGLWGALVGLPSFVGTCCDACPGGGVSVPGCQAASPAARKAAEIRLRKRGLLCKFHLSKRVYGFLAGVGAGVGGGGGTAPAAVRTVSPYVLPALWQRLQETIYTTLCDTISAELPGPRGPGGVTRIVVKRPPS